MLKALIIILFIAVVASLFSGLSFLLKDLEVYSSKRTLYALGIRIVLATTLLITIGIGIHTGEIYNAAPWG